MTKKISFFSFLTLFFLTQFLTAQIHVDANGNVGIGTETISSDIKLKLTFSGLSSESDHYGLFVDHVNSVSTYNYGIYSDLASVTKLGYGARFQGSYAGVIASTGGSACAINPNRYGGAFYALDGDLCNGIFARAYGFEKNYGVRGIAYGGTDFNYGIYGEANSTGSNRYAGYFNGDVHILGALTATGNIQAYASDKKVKENIKQMESVLEKIKGMEVKEYNYKKDKKLKLPNGKKYGLIAQDLEKIFPEMVTEISYPYNVTSDDPENPTQNEISETEIISYKAIYYDQLIPTLIKGLQEQQKMIEDLQKRVDKLEKGQ